jgi:hypothetical protein
MGFGSGGEGFTPGRNNLVGNFTVEGQISGSLGITGSYFTGDGGGLTNVGGGSLTLTIGNSIASGTSNRVLYQDGSDELAESSNLTFNGTTLAVATLDANGGAIDDVTVGATTPSSVQATTLSGSGTLKVVGATQLASTLNVTGAISGSSTLKVVGAAQFGSSIAATGSVTGNTFESTITTGTAPLVVASTTKVANLNADLLDGGDWVAPGALGSTTPAAVSATVLSASSTLKVVGATQLASTLNVTGAISGSAALDIGGTITGNDDLTIRGDTATIDLDADASTIPTLKLSRAGTMIWRFEVGTGNALNLTPNTDDADLVMKMKQSGVPAVEAIRLDASEEQVILNDSAGVIDFRCEGSGEDHLLFVDASADFVGIGSGAPTHLLTVGGAISGSSTLKVVGASQFGSSIAATGSVTADTFESTVSTGTSPLVVASTTKVTNLNADLLDGGDWATPSALGSSTPAAVTATTLTVNSALIGTPETVSGTNGTDAVSITTLVTLLVTSGGTSALTLAAGTAGQIKIITMLTAGSAATMTAAAGNLNVGTDIVWDAAGESVTLCYDGSKWNVVGSYGVTINN